MCWSSIPYQQIPLHVFTCYLEPKQTQDVRNRANRILAAIEQLLERESLARIIVTGDFNHMLPYMMEGLKRLNIFPIIPTEVATHRGGSQLDQIFTNQ